MLEYGPGSVMCLFPDGRRKQLPWAFPFQAEIAIWSSKWVITDGYEEVSSPKHQSQWIRRPSQKVLFQWTHTRNAYIRYLTNVSTVEIYCIHILNHRIFTTVRINIMLLNPHHIHTNDNMNMQCFEMSSSVHCKTTIWRHNQYQMFPNCETPPSVGAVGPLGGGIPFMSDIYFERNMGTT
jgi:hypothetical protein